MAFTPLLHLLRSVGEVGKLSQHRRTDGRFTQQPAVEPLVLDREANAPVVTDAGHQDMVSVHVLPTLHHLAHVLRLLPTRPPTTKLAHLHLAPNSIGVRASVTHPRCHAEVQVADNRICPLMPGPAGEHALLALLRLGVIQHTRLRVDGVRSDRCLVSPETVRHARAQVANVARDRVEARYAPVRVASVGRLDHDLSHWDSPVRSNTSVISSRSVPT